ncbi:pantoate kinase [Halovivax gelatinilyticus]|uniref:pantoate kinase n=1 Tax=Halovivax gelatinilyticus TaxID=2961597 RepID=UPI0020CA4853|nr:pantoate kinase [Halovivax gelatinilyticus]
MPDECSAFVPGHITGFFSTHPDDDPTRAGSRGAGLTLTDGVTTTVSPARESSIELDGSRVEIDPVERVLDALSVTARVEAVSSVPIGAGFGVSGAMALGTAYAANQVFDCRLSANELVTVAHGAEVQAGTGLGDVVAQARGGIPIRLEPGGPAHGRLDEIPTRVRVEYHSFGELSTESVLAGDTDRLDEAGRLALSRVVKEPTLTSFMFASRRFAREAGLLTDDVKRAVEAVATAGGQAAMAMLGNTVFALGTGLTDAGYDPSICATHPAGAMIE